MLFCVLSAAMAVCQTAVFMPISGHKDTVVSSITVRDDGQGPNGNYSTRANSSWTFHTSQPGNVFRVIVRHNFYRSQAIAGVVVYDGPQVGGNLLYGTWNNSGTSYKYSSRDSVTIVFNSDDDDPSGNWEVELCEAGGQSCWNLRTQVLGQDSVLLMWNEPSTDIHWELRYVELS